MDKANISVLVSAIEAMIEASEGVRYIAETLSNRHSGESARQRHHATIASLLNTIEICKVVIDEIPPDNRIEVIARSFAPRDIEDAPMDGTRIIAECESWQYRQGLGIVHVGFEWKEICCHRGVWREWCGTEDTQSTEICRPLRWIPCPPPVIEDNGD